MSDRHREVIWRGLDDPTRLDIVSVDFASEGGLVATGTQSTDTYRARWDLIVDDRWRTRMLTVDVEGFGGETAGSGVPSWERHLDLWRRDGRTATSEWASEGRESGDVPGNFGMIGVESEERSLLADAVDIDLSGCPLTNLMPIRRSGLHRRATGEYPITAAWVSLPDLAVRAATQAYSPAPAGLAAVASRFGEDVEGYVHYDSATRNVSVDLSLDSDALVLTYPDLAARLSLE